MENSGTQRRNISPVIVAGTGHAGFGVAAALREMGYAGRIVMIGDEPHRPYQRPPLSKGYLQGASDDAKLAMRSETFYAEKNLQLVLSRRLTALDRGRRCLVLDDGSEHEYGHLVLAVGARNRPLRLPGVELRGVHYLRTLEDARAIKGALASARNAVVVGAGFIGLEFAATAAKLGLNVTVVEVADRALARALTPEIAAIVAREHRSHGVRLMFSTEVRKMVGAEGAVVAVQIGGDVEIPADLVVVGIGVLPNSELADAAGLVVRNGIVVDELLATSDPDISAVGDCAAHPNAFAGGATVRIESVQNATDQARCLAARLVGKAAPYRSVPWFWSDQGNMKLQIAGLTAGYDQVVLRGSPDSAACSAFCFKQGQLLGVESLNKPGDHLTGRRLLAQHSSITAAQAADEAFDLKSLAAANRDI